MASFDILKALEQKGLLTSVQLQALEKESKTRNLSPEALLEEKKLISTETLAQLRSEALNLPLKQFARDEIIPREILLLIPQQSAVHYQMLAFAKDKQFLYVGMVKPENSEAQQALKFIAQGLGLGVKLSVISKDDLDRFTGSYTSFGEEVATALSVLKRQAGESQGRAFSKNALINLEETKGLSSEEAPIVKMVTEVIKNAVAQRASDIHIEPERTRLKVRYRVDGELSSVLFLPIEVHSSIITRVKIMANLKIDETRVPQDGRFGALLEGRQIDFRVSSFPTANGEKIAIRILDPSIGLKDLGALGLSQWNLGLIKKALQKPYGMILVTGPTGSGKTTTLYAVLQILNQDKVNVVTLEDPVEYFVAGVNQSQVLPEIGYSFASGLRSILRQDPDIIMVGEIRDNETAELAVHSALTGHVVLSTLHTNDAVGTVPRLLDLGVQKFLLPATLNIIVAQRLVRKLCPECKRQVEPTPEQTKIINEALSSLPAQLKQTLPVDKPYKLYEPVGCETCKGKGFLGRTGIYEILTMNPELEKIVLAQGSEEELYQEARRQGMVSLQQEAILHLLQGIIPFSEVVRETSSNF